MPLYRNYEPGDWVLCEVDARSHHKVICQMETEDRLDGVRFIRHAMPEDFRLYQCQFIGEKGKPFLATSDFCRLPTLKYFPTIIDSRQEWEPIDYSDFRTWAIEDTEIVAGGMLICSRGSGPFYPDTETPIVMNAIAHVPLMIAALQAVESAHSQKQKTAALKKVKDVLRSLDIIK